MKKLLILTFLAILWGLFSSVFADTVTIGTGTSTQRYPLGSYFGYERSASIYTDTELGAVNARITALAWYATTSTAIAVPTRIYLKNTSAAALTSDTWANLISGATLVYDQTQTTLTTGIWNTLTLSTSFDCEDGSGLLVLVERNYGSTGAGASTGAGIRYTSVTNTHETIQADTTPPIGSGTLSAYRPNITLTYTTFGATTAPNAAVVVSPANAAVNVLAAATLNWNNGGGSPSGYRLSFGTDGGGLSRPTNLIDNQDMLTARTFDPTPDLILGTTYYWQIVPYNSFGDAAPCPVWSFSTLPAPLTGSKTINPSGSGSDNYTSFAAAVTALNAVGIGAGGVTFLVSDDAVFTEEVPVITASGTTANPIVFQRTGTGTARPVIKPTTSLQGIKISGGDYLTFDGIDIMVASGQIPNYGFFITNASATNGAQYNTLQNCKITLNKANTATKGIYHYYTAVPTSAAGANSYNTYQSIQIENSSTGVYCTGGSSTYPDLANVVRDCTIGGVTPGDMGGTGVTYGIYLYYQSGIQAFNNEIRNITQTSGTSVYGIYLTTCYGENLIFNNKIHDLTLNYNTAANNVYGICLSMATSGTNVTKAYNNMVWGLSHLGYTSTTGSFLVYGIYNAGSTSTNTYYIDNNSVAIAGPAYGNSTCYYAAAVTAVNKTRNNAFANLTSAQSGSQYHYCYYSYSATSIGAAGSVSNNNVMYIAAPGNGYPARGSATNFATLAAWTAAMGAGIDNLSRPSNPMFVSSANLHIQAVATPVESRATEIGWVTTDIDGDARAMSPLIPDIGADEGAFILEPVCTAPIAQPTALSLIPAATAIEGSFTAAIPAAEAYLVVRHTVTPLGAVPVDGTIYGAGSALGANGYIVSAGSGTTFSTSGLTVNTTYYFTIFAFNQSGTEAPKYNPAGPLSGNISTFPAAPANPAAFSALAYNTTRINLTATANATGSNILVAWNGANTFGSPISTAAYSNGNTIAGGGTVWYVGTAAGLTNHTGLIPGTTYYYKAWSYDVVSGSYNNYSSGSPTNAVTPLPSNPATFTAIAVSPSQISLTAAANSAGNSIMVAWNTTGTFGTPVITTAYTNGSTLAGGGTVFYVGSAAALPSHVGLTQLTAYYYKVWSLEPIAANNYYSAGITANVTTPMIPVSTYPWSETFGTTGAAFPPVGWARYSGLLNATASTLTPATSGWIAENYLYTAQTPVNLAARMNVWSSNQYWLITPPLDIPNDGNTYNLMFDMGLTAFGTANVAGTSGSDDKFGVLVSDGTSWTAANVARQWDNAGSPYVYNSIPNTGTSTVITLTGLTGVKHIAFYGESTVSNADNNLYVDNVRVFTGAYDELAITAFTAPQLYKFAGQDITLNLTVKNNGTTSTGKSVVIKQGTTVIGSVPVGTLANGASVDLTLSYIPVAAGSYTYTAELPADMQLANNAATVADQTIYPAGTLVEGFEDAAFPPSRWLKWNTPYWIQGSAANAYDGAKHAKVTLTASSTGSYLATPKLTITAADSLSFYAKSSTSGRMVQIKYSAANDSTGTWTDYGLPQSLTTSYLRYVLPLASLAGNNYRFAIVGLPNGAAGTIYVDKIIGPMIYNPPEPPGPPVMVAPLDNATNVDPLTVVLDWDIPLTGGIPTYYSVNIADNIDDMGNQISFNVNAATTQWQPNSGASPIVLNYNTQYYWIVVPGNDSSADTGLCPIYSFTTKPQMTTPVTHTMGSVFPSSTKTGVITVTNLGLTPLTFNAAGADFTFGSGFTVPAYGTFDLPYAFLSPATLGAYSGTVTLTETSPGNSTVSINVTATITTDIVFGSGSANLYMPVYPYFGYTYSQTIYPASWFTYPDGYRIEKLYYYFNATSAPTNTTAFKVWMGHTTQANYATVTNVPVASQSLVFDGNWTITAGAGWKELVLTTPFIYNKTDNLVITMDENTPGYDASGNANTSYFRSTASTPSQGVSYYSDSVNPDPENLTTSPLVSRGGYPNTKFYVAPVPQTPIFAITPAARDFGTVFINTTHTQTFTVRNDGGGSLVINTLGISGDACYSLTGLPILPVTLTSGQATTFGVNYLPTAAGTQSATVTLTDDRAMHTVSLNGVSTDLSGGYYLASSLQTTAPSYPTYEWIDISTSGTPLASLGDDSSSSALPLGFTFPFFGNNYTTVIAASNGYLTFGTGTSVYANTTLPTAATPNNLIAWLWDDFNPADSYITDDWVRYQALDGKFVITYYKLPEFSSSGATEWITAQIILYPSGKIKIQYHSKSTALLMDNTVGIENSTGTTGLQYRYSDGTTSTGGAIFGTSGEPLALAFGTDINGLGDAPVLLVAPEVTLSHTLTGLHLSWAAIPGANSYTVYTTTDPYGIWTPYPSLGSTAYDMPWAAVPALGFLKVTASTAAPVSPAGRSTDTPISHKANPGNIIKINRAVKK